MINRKTLLIALFLVIAFGARVFVNGQVRVNPETSPSTPVAETKTNVHVFESKAALNKYIADKNLTVTAGLQTADGYKAILAPKKN